jgi:hypothetical protein
MLKLGDYQAMGQRAIFSHCSAIHITDDLDGMLGILLYHTILSD